VFLSLVATQQMGKLACDEIAQCGEKMWKYWISHSPHLDLKVAA